MPLSKPQLDEIKDYAERFVGAFVKCNCPNSKYTVSGNTCDLLEDAVRLAMARCARPPVKAEEVSDQDYVLSLCLGQAISELNCP